MRQATPDERNANLRQALNGAVNRGAVLNAEIRDLKLMVGMLCESVMALLNDNRRLRAQAGEERLPSVQEVADAVERVTGFDLEDLRSRFKDPGLPEARSMFVAALRERRRMSYPETAHALGRTSHAGVKYAYDRLMQDIAQGSDVALRYARVLAALDGETLTRQDQPEPRISHVPAGQVWDCRGAGLAAGRDGEVDV